MLYTCYSDGVVEPLDPPPESNPGDRVFVAGYEQDPAKGKYYNLVYISFMV